MSYVDGKTHQVVSGAHTRPATPLEVELGAQVTLARARINRYLDNPQADDAKKVVHDVHKLLQ